MIKKFLVVLLTLLALLTPLVRLYAEDEKSVEINYIVSAKIEFLDVDSNPIDSLYQELEVGKTIEEPSIELVPKVEGKVFAGWYIGDNLYDFNTPVEDHVTLISKYKDPKEVLFVELSDDADYDIDFDIDVNGIPLTNDELYLLSKENSLHYILSINNVSSEDIIQGHKEKIDNVVSSDRNVLLNYVNIVLTNVETKKIKSKLNIPMSISITIPEEEYSSNYTYSFYGIDESGNSVLLCKGKADNQYKINFSVDLLYDSSSFALAYKKNHSPEPFTPAKTGIDVTLDYCHDTNTRLILYVLLLISLIICADRIRKGDR